MTQSNSFKTPHKRYMTNGVQSEIPVLVQTVIWLAIDSMTVKRDYLQVFTLTKEIKNGRPCQIIRHEQEDPPFHQTLVAHCPDAVDSGKLFVMEEADDDGTPIWIMLLAEEY